MKDIKKIIYISRLCSPKVMDYLFSTSLEKPRLCTQKFHFLIAKGLALYSETCKVNSLSAVPVTPRDHKRKFWKISSEVVDNVEYSYVPMINLPFIKHPCLFTYTFLRLLYLGLRKEKEDKVFICDILNLTISSAALLASKFIRVKTVAIITDMPGLMVSSENSRSLVHKVFNFFVSKYMVNYDGYILLTEQMNEKVNPHDKPYMVMEGLVDKQMDLMPNRLEEKADEKILIYAGGIYEKYGIKKLILAFMRLDMQDIGLHIYGSGPMAADMPRYMEKDRRIKYFGMVPNEEVVKEELKATLLINPRPSSEELTKYSFPSKNMEYMVSGTPIVTTPLPGMPEEYNEYVYLFEDESVEGIYKTLDSLLSKPREELHEFGYRAKRFVIDKKNNAKQANTILAFLERL